MGIRAMNRVWLKYLPRPLQRRLDARHSVQGMISNSAWLFADRLFRMAGGLTLGVLIARQLGPESFGLLSYAMAFVALFGMIATLGLDGVVVRELTAHPEQKQVILGSTLALKFVGGLFAYAIVMVSVALMEPANPETELLVAIIAAGLVFQAFDTADLWFQSQVAAKYVVFARSSAFLTLCVVKVWFLLHHASVQAFAWAAMLEVALAGAALAIAFKAAGSSPAALRFEWPMARRLLAESWPLAISGMFVLLTMQLDKVLIGEIAGNAQVGIYSVASQISSVWYMVPVIVGTSIAPALVKSHAMNNQSYAENLQKVYTTLTWISLATAIAVFFLSGPLVGFLFGPNYHEAADVLAVHVWGGVFVFHVSIRTRALIVEGKQCFVTAIAALTLLSSIFLNIMLIASHGALGAAYASMFSWALCALVFPTLWPETRQSVAMLISSLRVFDRK